MKTTYVAMALAAAMALSSCTTAQKTGGAAVAGGLFGAAVGNSVGAAVAGAAIAGFGVFLLETADGQCQYRNSKGQVYTTKCHWK